MAKRTKAQAAFEYLTTYGWAILAALIVTGALAYFGFLNPTNLLPNKCDFGRQLECADYKIVSSASGPNVYLKLRNNFGKPIDITAVAGDEVLGVPVGFTLPLTIQPGATEELQINLNQNPPAGEKKEVDPVIIFSKTGGTNLHNITGVVFVTVQ
jgi:hypothetical protein